MNKEQAKKTAHEIGEYINNFMTNYLPEIIDSISDKNDFSFVSERADYIVLEYFCNTDKKLERITEWGENVLNQYLIFEPNGIVPPGLVFNLNEFDIKKYTQTYALQKYYQQIGEEQ